jgi:hypothetical protein
MHTTCVEQPLPHLLPGCVPCGGVRFSFQLAFVETAIRSSQPVLRSSSQLVLRSSSQPVLRSMVLNEVVEDGCAVIPGAASQLLGRSSDDVEQHLFIMTETGHACILRICGQAASCL